MKKLTYLMMTALMAMGMAACSEQIVPENESGSSFAPTDKAYMQVKVTVPGATKAEPTEDGKEEESKINTIQILLYDATGKTFIAASNQPKISGGKGFYNVSFSMTDLYKAAADAAETKLTGFIICNSEIKVEGKVPALDEIKDLGLIGDPSTNEAYLALDKAPWNKAKGFIMTGKNNGDLTLPSKAELKKHNDPTNPCSLGTFNVERAAARFDIANKTGLVDGSVYKYEIENGKNEKLYVELTDVAFTNLSTKYYALRRVSADGKNPSTEVDYFGAETATNYVVDTDAEAKIQFVKNNSAVTPYDGVAYSYPAFLTDKTSLIFTSLASIAGGTADNSWTGDSAGDYRIWSYATENTTPKAKPVDGCITGVVFKGRIGALDGYADAAKINNPGKTDHLYVFKGKLYSSWESVKTFATISSSDPGFDAALTAAYNAVVADMAAAVPAVTGEPTPTIAASRNFTVYGTVETSTGSGLYYYPVYYVYWNKHRVIDTYPAGTPLEEKPMRYGVVRNNVYKLRVNKITQFGIPETTPGDPDVDTPVTPPEDENAYFEVSVQVLPWTVRQSDIEF